MRSGDRQIWATFAGEILGPGMALFRPGMHPRRKRRPNRKPRGRGHAVANYDGGDPAR
jgi:hypothetical protein